MTPTNLKTFDPLQLRNDSLQSRLMMSLFPSGKISDGTHTEDGIEFFRCRAASVGLMVIEGPTLDGPQSGGGKLRLINNHEHVRALTKAVRNEGCLPLVQLSHSGAFPNDVQKGDKSVGSLVDQLAIDEIEDIKKRFALNANAAMKAGFAGVEVQAGYGHLLAQFLSPQSNHRTDQYGGEVAGRTLLLQEVLHAVREALGPNGILQVKLCVEEFIPHGWRFSEARDLLASLDPGEVDVVLITVGGKSNKELTIPTHYLPDGYLHSFSRQLKAVSRCLIAVGEKIKNPAMIEKYIETSTTDLVSMSRAFFADPKFASKMRDGLWEDIRPCISCNECTNKDLAKDTGVKGRLCNVNPEASQELRVKTALDSYKARVKEPRRIAVIGGGPAGIQSALTFSALGDTVDLYEAAAELGGSFRFAGLAPHKAVVLDILSYLKAQVKKSGVNVFLSRPVQDDLDISIYSHVMVSPGQKKADPKINGDILSRILYPADVFKNIEQFEPGRSVVILGGGSTGIETAHAIAEQIISAGSSLVRADLLESNEKAKRDATTSSNSSSSVTVIEAADTVLSSMNKLTRKVLLGHLEKAGVMVLKDTRIAKIAGQKATIDISGKEKLLHVDDLVICTGGTPDTTLYEALRRKAEAMSSSVGQAPQVHLIGDAKKPGQLGSALRDGLFTSIEI